MTGAWKLALRNLRRHRRRNAVTALAISLGYAGLVVLGGYAIRIETLVRDNSVFVQHRGHLSIYARGGLKRAEAKPSAFALPLPAQERIAAVLREDRRVELVGRYLVGSGIAGNGCKSFPFRAVGVEPELERRIMAHPAVVALLGGKVEPRAGRFVFDAADVESPAVLAPRFATYVGKGAAAEAGGRAGPGTPGALDCGAHDLAERIAADPFLQLGARTEDGSFGALDVRAVGLYHAASTEEEKTGLVAPLETLQRLFDTERVTYFAAYLRDHRDTPAVVRDAGARLAAAGVDVSIYPYDDQVANPYLVGTMGFIGGMVFFIVVLVATVVAFSVLNAMTLAVLERTRELGTLRSLGFTRRDVTGLFLREAALLTAGSIAVGAGLALAVAAVVKAADIRFAAPGMGYPLRLLFTPTPAVFAGVAVLFLVLSVGATFVAVRRRARQRVAVLMAEVAA